MKTKTNSSAIIELKDIVKVYDVGTPRETKALQGVSFTVKEGEIVIVFGPSGSGKSTLLNILAGLLEPTAGSIVIQGKNLQKMTPREAVAYHQSAVGMVFQAYELIPTFTVIQNITMPARLLGTPRAEYAARGQELLSMFQLEELGPRLPTDISGGQQQRVGIMRALMNQPSLIVADEPTGNLDSVNASQIMDLLEKISREARMTMIIVSHDPALFKVADRILYIRDGRVEKEELGHRTKPVAEQPGQKAARRGHKEAPSQAPRQLETVASTPFGQLVAQREQISSVQQGILAVLMILLTRTQQDALTEETLTRLIGAIEGRIAGALNQNQLQRKLDMPVADGGVGLYRQTAEHLASNIEAILLLTAS